YGIFEKNAYDKKTTHDDFGMAVTYVAIDYYLKTGGKLGFLLPASFIKSSKGGQGFRKFDIVRNGQEVPFSVERIDDFSDIKLFSIPSMAFFIKKGDKTTYPMEHFNKWHYKGKKEVFDSHSKWSAVSNKLKKETLTAFPVSKKDIQSSWLTILDEDVELARKVLADEEFKPHYKGRKGIEPAGAKGVFIIKTPIASNKHKKNVVIINDLSRQRRKDILSKGVHEGEVEPDLIFPMLGGRNIQRWRVVSHEYLLLPHTSRDIYGIPEADLTARFPLTYQWLNFYRKELLASRIQNGKFFDSQKHPFYRLDNVGPYTYSKYKVLWKEQTGSMSAVVVGNAKETLFGYQAQLLGEDKPIVTDSKILSLALDDEMEAHFVCAILNAPSIRYIIDSYAVSTNRGVEVLEYLNIPLFDKKKKCHLEIAQISKDIHALCKNCKEISKENEDKIKEWEKKLDKKVIELFSNAKSA
uniref:hypothetical protein n=1 Tax=Turicimonas muris TaxID=1796652 RepID=UPI00402AC647